MQRTQAMGITAVVVALLGAVVGLVGVLVCTLRRAGTDRLRARDAQQASEERFAKLFESSPLASGLVSLRDRKFLAVNKAFTKLFGWHPDELVGRMTSSLTFYADATLTGSIYSRLERGGSFADYEVTLLTKSGERREVVCSAEYIVLDGEPAALGVFLDATDRKRAEADQRQSADLARESDRRFRELAENIREVFWLATPDLSQILYVSPAYETLLGRRAADLYANARDWLAAIHPADRERVTTQAAQLAVTGNFDEQYRVVRPDGAIRWIRARGFTVRDDEGRALRLAGVAEDMTERLVLEDQLRQTQKMESLGLLAGGVAHDFNNVLTIISSAAGLLGEDLAKDHPSRELVDEIDQAVARASALTRQLLAFSRKQLV